MTSHFDHVRFVIEHDNSAMTEDGVGFGELVITDPDIEFFNRKQTAERAAHLHRLESSAGRHSTAKPIQHLFQRGAKRNFNKPRLFDPPTDLQGDGPARLLRAH